MTTQSPAAKLKWALLGALTLVMAWMGWTAYTQSVENVEQLRSWQRHEGEIKDLRQRGWAQVEIAKALAQSLPTLRRPESDPSPHGKALVLLASHRYASYEHFHPVQLMQDPAQPDRLVILDETAMWLPVAAKLLLVAAVAACWLWLFVTPWPRDRTWTPGAWRETDSTVDRAAAGALLAEPIKEPKGNQMFAAVLGLALSLPFALWMLAGIGSHPLEAGLLLVVALAVLGLSLRSVVKKYTRRVRFDQAGLTDADFFGVRRVPWGAVKSMKLVNLNAKAQRLYDRNRLRDSEGSRPEDDMGAWDVCGEQGVVLLRLYRNMVPQDALSALREHIQQRIRNGGRDVFGFAKRSPEPGVPAAEAPHAFVQEAHALVQEARVDDEGRRVLDPSDPRDRKLIEEHEAIRRRMDQVGAEFAKRGKSVERIMKGFMALTFLLPLAGTCYLGYQSLWFRFAAAETQGRVVSIHPALVVEYRETGRLVRDSVAAHDDHSQLVVGANVRVFYDPADPERVRLDLFDEMWFSLLALGGLTLFVGVLAGAVWWGTMRHARPTTTRGAPLQ